MSDGDHDLRVRLVRTGVALLAERGDTALTLREVARRAGVSHGAPRRYFPAHRDLLAAIAKEGYRALAAEVTAVIGADDPGVTGLSTAIDAGDPGPTGNGAYARVLAVARAYLKFAETRPEMFALMFRHDLLRGNAEGLRQASLPLFDILARLVAAARPGTTAPDVVAAALWANLHGLAQLRRWGSLQLVTGTDEVEPVLRAALAAHLGPADDRSDASTGTGS